MLNPSLQVPLEKSSVTFTVKSYLMQDFARQILPEFKGLSACLRAQVPCADVSIHQSIESDNPSHSYRGLCRCGSTWVCKPCASKISLFRSRELEHGISHFSGIAEMVTFTVPHYVDTDLVGLRSGMVAALRHFFNSRSIKSILKSVGYVGRIRVFEVTYTENGFHPHFHVAFFLKKSLAPLKLELFEQWRESCLISGLNKPLVSAFFISDADMVRDYFARYGAKWGLQDEMVRGHLKVGKNSKSISPFSMLERAMSDDKYIRLFRIYALAFKGSRQLVYSRGLKSVLGIDDISDESIVQNSGLTVCRFMVSPITWRLVLRHRLRAELLDMCNSSDDETVIEFLSDITRGRNFPIADYL